MMKRRFLVAIVAVMMMTIAILGGVVYQQQQMIGSLEIQTQTMTSRWREEFHRNNELSMENEELSANLKSTTDRKNELYQQLVVHR